MSVKKSASVFRRLIILFIIIIIPVTLMSSVFINSNKKNLEKQVLDSAYNSTLNFASSFDKELSLISISMEDLSVNSKVTKLCYLYNIIDKFELSQNIRNVRELLSKIKESHGYINNTRIYIRNLSRVYNAVGYEFGSAQVITSKTYEDLLAVRNNDSLITLHDNGFYIMNYSSISDTRNIIETELDIMKLKNYLQANTAEGSFYIFTIGTSGQSITNITDDKLQNHVLEQTSLENGATHITFDKAEYYAFRVIQPLSRTSFIVLTPNDLLLQPLQAYSYALFGFIFIVLVCITIFFIGCNIIIHKPLKKLIHGFGEVESGNFNVRIPVDGEDDFTYLYHHFNDMTENLDRQITQNYQQKLLLQKAELKQLQSQINPHFLYNSFFMLHRMIISGMQEQSEAVSKMLGQYFKFITYNHEDIIELKSEYAHAQVYSNIQALRFEGRITVLFEPLPTEYESILVPKLVLQPLLENAFNYGLESMVADGLLRVSITKSENHIVISVEDNGTVLTDETLEQINQNISEFSNPITSKETSALLNIYKRIRIYSENRGDLTVTRSTLGGMNVSLCLFIQIPEQM